MNETCEEKLSEEEKSKIVPDQLCDSSLNIKIEKDYKQIS